MNMEVHSQDIGRGKMKDLLKKAMQAQARMEQSRRDHGFYVKEIVEASRNAWKAYYDLKWNENDTK